MKIYTEVNYKWLDGQLVETDSKSFEYNGEITLCMPGVGGGGGGGGGGSPDPISSAITSVAETVDDVVKDPVGTTTDILGETITTAGESLEPAAEGVGNILDQTGDVFEEGLSTGTESLAMNEGVATTLGDLGDNINTNMRPIVEEGNRWMDAATTNIDSGLGFITDKALEVSDFIHGPSSPSDVKLDKDKLAIKGAKKKKNKSDLAVNKAKKRSRKSLRV